MLHVPASLLRAMWDHARQEHPLEACGVLPGPKGGQVPQRWVPMVNVERSSSWFRFDPQAQMDLWREMDARGEYPAVVYHSHPHTGPDPSSTDLAFMRDERTAYVILSVPQELARAYRVSGGVVSAGPIQTLDT